MDRREFSASVLNALGAGIAAGAAPSLALAADGSAMTPRGYNLAHNLSVMIWTILPDQPFEHRMAVVAEAGYRFIELYDEFESWSPAEYARMNKLRRSLGLAVDAVSVKKYGVSDPANAGEFLEELQTRIAIANRFECRDLIVLSGNTVPKLSKAQQCQASIDTLKRAGDVAAKGDCRILLESLDPEEEPHWFLNSVSEGFDIVRAVGNPHVRMLYDFYHEQISGGNLIKKLVDNQDLVALVHVADVPGRHQPGTGEVNYRAILQKLAQIQFSGKIAMEFLPVADPLKELREARRYVESAVAKA
jgi:hydroxypyruvate isomerase